MAQQSLLDETAAAPSLARIRDERRQELARFVSDLKTVAAHI
jgi:hypothetical protein